MPSSRDPPLCLSQTPRNLIVFNTTSLIALLSKSLLHPTQRSCRHWRMAVLATRWWIVHQEGALQGWLGCMLTVCHQLVCPARSLVLSVFRCLFPSQLPATDWITLFWNILAFNLQSLKDSPQVCWMYSLSRYPFRNPYLILIVRLNSWFLKVVLVILLSDIVPVIMMVGVRYNPFLFATTYS